MNAPGPPTPLQTPVNVYFKSELTINTPDAGALAAHVHAHTPSPVPPAPSTPDGSSIPFGPSTSVGVAKPKAPRAKKGTGQIEYDKTGNQPEKQQFPKFEDLISTDQLDRTNKNTLRDMINFYGVDIEHYASMSKNKLLSAIKKKYKVIKSLFFSNILYIMINEQSQKLDRRENRKIYNIRRDPVTKYR